MKDVKGFIERQVKEIREKVGKEKAVVALSGGVDSSAVAVLAHRALGEKLFAFFIDDGLMREHEGKRVKEIFAGQEIELKIFDAQEEFFRALKGKDDPEEKRKAFRDIFYRTLGKIVKGSGAKFMLQGTIKADIMETKGGVKTQHNILEQIGINPEQYGFVVVEPLRELLKFEVREVAKELGLPEEISQRMPFPGPGLATRIVGEVTRERAETVRKACRIVEEETAELKPFQAFAVLLNDRATGLGKNKERAFGEIIVVRSVESRDALTAEPTELSWEKMHKIRDRILEELPEVKRVLYDLTPKPPATIEYV